jgi:hypothetical protein
VKDVAYRVVLRQCGAHSERVCHRGLITGGWGYTIEGVGCLMLWLGFPVFKFWFSVFGFRFKGFGFWVLGFRFWVLGFGIGLWRLGFSV